MHASFFRLEIREEHGLVKLWQLSRIIFSGNEQLKKRRMDGIH